MVTLEQLLALAPTLTRDAGAAAHPHLTAGMERFEITSPLRQAAYLATLFEESRCLTSFEENLNYSAQRLVAVWPHRFPSVAHAQLYAHNPERLANYVYGGRLGNTSPGDGWRYRGRGPIQATGRDMYLKVGAVLALDLIANPELLVAPENGFASAAWIFAIEKNCNAPADRADMREVTRRVNGGSEGLPERVAYFDRARAMLGD